MRALLPARVCPPVGVRSLRRASRPRAPLRPSAAKGAGPARRPQEDSSDPKVQKLLEAFRATSALSLRSVSAAPDWLAALLPDAELPAVMRRDPEMSSADPAAARASLDALTALVGPDFDALRMAEIYPSLLRQAPATTRDMYAKVQAFYGSEDVRETVFLRPDLLHASTAKLMVEWAAERDEREKRKPKKKKKAAKAAAVKEASDSDESDEDDDDDELDDGILAVDDSDDEDTPEEVAQAAQEATAAARRAAEAFKEMGLPAPRGFGAPRPAAAPAAPAAAAPAAKAKAKAKDEDLPPLAADEIDEEDVIDGGESDDELSEEDKNAFEADLLAAEKRARAAMALQRDEDDEDDSPLSAAVARVEARTLRGKVRIATAKGETVKPAGKPKKVKGKDSERRRKRELQQSPWLRSAWATKKKEEDD